MKKIDPLNYLAKEAAPRFPSYPTDLKPYQKRVVDRISKPNQPGLVVAHGVGSGKTRSSIEAYKNLKMPTNVIVPAALKTNYEKEMTKWTGSVPKNVNILSQQRIARQGMPNNNNGLEIVDESHRARDLETNLHDVLQNSHPKKRLLLTGTPLVNHPTDLTTLVNLAAQKNMLPTNRSEFNRQYVTQKLVQPGLLGRLSGVKPGVVPELKNKGQLGKVLNKYVDYYPGSTEGYPSSQEQIVKVPLGDKQMNVYKTLMNQAPWYVRYKVKRGLPPGKGELQNLQAFLTGARQVSNTNQEFVSRKSDVQAAKIQQAFKFLQSKVKEDPTYKSVVYSNFINSGIAPYRDLLTKANIPYGEFTGEMSKRVRDQSVKDYNAGKLRALLISGSGAEGLDLKKTRNIQLLSPEWNMAREKQVIGRGIRYGSHVGLPKEKQNVLVQRYMAEPQGGLLDRLMGKKNVKGTDEYIYDTARRKEMLNNEVLKLLDH